MKVRRDSICLIFTFCILFVVGAHADATKSECPEGTTRFPGDTACIEITPALAQAASELEYSTSDQTNTHDTVLQVYTGPTCRSGFMRPPGVKECIARDIIYGLEDSADVIAPRGSCPRDWFRPNELEYCIPLYTVIDLQRSGLHLTAEQQPPQCSKLDDDGLHAYATCCKLEVETWTTLPLYLSDGRYSQQQVVAKACTPLNLTTEFQ